MTTDLPGELADRLVDAAEDALARQRRVEPKALERVLRPDRFQPRHRDGDALLLARPEHIEQDLPRERSGRVRDVPYRVDGDRLILGNGTEWQAVLMRTY